MNKTCQTKRVTRALDGILLLDKPCGISSNRALQQAKRLFKAAKAGHTGSLDPLATGMLPVCFGHATKLSGMMLDADKAYRVTGKLGEKTDSGDAEGDLLVTQPVPTLTSSLLKKCLADFEGEILQIPPMYSALKSDGKRLYELARKGIEVERKAREVTIYKLELVDFNELEITLDVECSKGTYIRTLVEDIAQKLGTVAHVVALRRRSVAQFKESSMVTLEQIESEIMRSGSADHLLQPVDLPIQHLPQVELDEHTAFYLMRGQPVQVPCAPDASQIRLYDASRKKFIGIGEMQSSGLIAPKRLFIS